MNIFVNKPLELEDIFEAHFGSKDSIEKFFAPGRVNLIGEHIDYNGGFVFPAALTLGITAFVKKKSDGIIRMRSTNLEGEIIVDLNKDIIFKAQDNWGNYPKGIIAHLKSEGLIIQGCDILFSSNLPDGAGLSSSAALLVLTGYTIMSLSGIREINKIILAKMCRQVENNFIGVNCGIMDQFSIAMGLKNHAMLLDCNSLEYNYVPLQLGEYSLLIMNTNKKRELADSKYNERRAECDAAYEILKKRSTIKNLSEASIIEVEEFLKNEPLLLKRARHVTSENQRVLKSVESLKAGNLMEFGRLMTASHNSLKNDYEVTGYELDIIVEEALKINGCIGARMTGAGFGGCAIALVETFFLDVFIDELKIKYNSRTDLKADFYESSIGDGVLKIIPSKI